jgi:endonuclease YncB( thermonuclease family)
VFAQLFKSPLMPVSVILLACSTYFFIGAQKIIAKRATTALAYFKDGSRVTVMGPHDGDEIEIRDKEGHQAIVRLLGIKAFAKSAKNARLDEVTKASMQYMATYAEGKEATIRVRGKPTKGRSLLLAYVELDGVGEGETADLGLRLVERGYAVVFTRYPFERENSYRVVERKALEEKRGLWADEGMKRRVTEARVTWSRTRAEAEVKK